LHERLPVLAVDMDVLLIGMAYYAAYLIRWEPAELGAEMAYFQRSLPVVLAGKLVVFAWVGAYGSRWKHFGMEDGVRMVQANLFGTILVAAALLLLQRVGLSRGVLIIDFFVCAVLTTGARFSFRLMEGVTRRFSSAGRAAVAVGPLDDAELILRELERDSASGLRLVAVADPGYGPARGRFRGLPVFGGGGALVDAVDSSGAHAVVLVRRDRHEAELPDVVRRHLRHEGSLDVYVLSIGLHRLEGGAPARPEGPS
jgi:FlaA1/EpsC-like NDP-sugar epimerase